MSEDQNEAFQQPQDIGLSEAAEPEQLTEDDVERREAMALPSDMRDVGDPEGWDVGIPGGSAAGGEMGEGGRDHDPVRGDAWGSDIQPEEVL